MLNDTTSKEYSNWLHQIQKSPLKLLLKKLNPYRIHLNRIVRGSTLEIGCGIGRVLGFLGKRAVGVDHNTHAINYCKQLGYNAYTVDSFFNGNHAQENLFDTILLSHVCEHMTVKESFKVINQYLYTLKKNGKLILITPQEKGYESDPSHIEYINFKKLEYLCKNLNMKIINKYSFPFPRSFGKFFIYNEFVVHAIFKPN